MPEDTAPQSTSDVITSTLNEQFGPDWNADASPDTEIIEVGSEADAGTSDARSGDDSPDGDTDTDTPAGDIESVVADKESAATTDDGDDTDKELEALGIKRPKAGERENRLPYTRMKKIFGNAKKKWDETVLQPKIQEYTGKVTAYEDTIGRYKATDTLIHTDPDRFMQVLAKLNPSYERFLNGGSTAKPNVPAFDPNDKRPEPDFQYPDGSKGYTPEGFDKVMEWNARQAVKSAVAEARKEWEKDFGPIKQEREQAQKYREDQERRQASVNDQISRTRKVWGDKVLTENKDEIIAKLAADKTLNFGDAVAAVMYPKLSANRDTIHADVVKELQQRPAAAQKKVATGSGTPDAKDVKDMSTEEVILQSLREQGLVR